MRYICSRCGKRWDSKTSANVCCGRAIEVKKFQIPNTETVYYVSMKVDAQAKEDAYERVGPRGMLRNSHDYIPYLIMYGYYLHEYQLKEGK